MAEINNSAIIVEFVILLFAIQFAVSYGDNNNEKHLARCIQFYDKSKHPTLVVRNGGGSNGGKSVKSPISATNN